MTRWHKSKDAALQFLSGNVYKRVPIFREPVFCKLLLESLDYCRKKYELQIHAFVIMPEHFHLLLTVPQDGVLSDFLRDWKGFTAHKIVTQLREEGRKRWLGRFRANGHRRKDPSFRIFQPDTHLEGIASKGFARQKLNYIHRNPLQAGLAEQEVDYPYSSARNWFLNGHSVFRIDPVEL